AMWRKWRRSAFGVVLDYAAIVLAGLLYAIALHFFVLPSRVVLTGSEGIAAALSYYFESELLFVILYLIFQTILLTFAWFRVSRVFARRSMVVVGVVALCLTLLPEMEFASPESENERIILVIFGGLIAGLAKALAFVHRGSTGDEDVPAAYFAMRYLKPVGSIAIIAATISTAFGLFMEGLKTGDFERVVNTLMYTGVFIFISAQTLNILYRKFQLTMICVITQVPDQVGAAIRGTSEHRSYVVQEGIGGHSKQGYRLVQTIVTHEELPDMLAAIERATPGAFFYYHDVEGTSKRYYIAPIG
ncbi:MAG: YitT family protein, partial [Planctomycetota bacterium]